MTIRSEFVPNGQAIWNADEAMNYQCPICYRWVFSQYEGKELPTIACEADGHRLRWPDEDPTQSNHVIP
jgi:hypothetical protein